MPCSCLSLIPLMTGKAPYTANTETQTTPNIMKTTLLLLLLLPVHSLMAQSEEDLIGAVLQKYIDGTSQNDPALIMEAFYEGAHLFLSKEGQEIWLMPVQEYASGFTRGERGKPNGRTGKILDIDQQHDLALAKVEIVIPSRELKFIDVFILKRLSGTWKIISKAATQID